MHTGDLASLTSADVAEDTAIVNYLKTHPRLKAIVTREAVCYLVPDPDPYMRRLRRGLLDLVGTHYKTAPQIVDITPIEYSRFKDTQRPRSGREQAADKHKANRTIDYVFTAAIDAKASDVYLDIGRSEAVLSFRTHGYKREIERFGVEDGLQIARSLWALDKNSQFDPGEPCDCATTFDYAGRRYRIRGNSVKDIRGPSIVCRIRDPEFILPLDTCGYSPQFRQVHDARRAHGGRADTPENN